MPYSQIINPVMEAYKWSMVSEISYSVFTGVKAMNILSSVGLGAALAADAMAVSVIRGAESSGKKYREALLTSAVFGIFQMLMPVLGWSIGKVGSDMAAGFDKIIAFVILLFIGLKMILDSRHDSLPDVGSGGAKELLLLALATGIDALASGITLPVSVGAYMPMQMFFAVIIIGAVTFMLCFVSFSFGTAFNRLRPMYLQIMGGTVLVLIGLKTLLF